MYPQKQEENTLGEILKVASGLVFGIMAIVVVIPLVFLVFILLGLFMAHYKIQELGKGG